MIPQVIKTSMAAFILLATTPWTFGQEGPVRLPQKEDTQWIWDQEGAATEAPAGDRFFRLRFEAQLPVQKSVLVIQCDNQYTVWLNGKRLGGGTDWKVRHQYELTGHLEDTNVLAVQATNEGRSPAGLAAALVIVDKSGARYLYSGEADWRVSSQAELGWQTVASDKDKWEPAVSLGRLDTAAPWAGQMDRNNVVQKSIRVVERATQEQFHLLPTDRLTWLGGTFVERLQYDGRLEAQLQEHLAAPEKSISIRNLGWSGDDVWGTARAVFGQQADGMRRLEDDLARTNPTVVALCYGANESFAGAAGLPRFEAGLKDLIRRVGENGAQLVLVTPPPFESLGGSLPDMQQANQDLSKYCDAIRHISQQNQLPLIDLHSQWPDRETAGQPLTYNGVHLNREGYRIASERLFDGFLPGVTAEVPSSKLIDLVQAKNELYFHRYRPQNETYLFLFRKHEQGNNAVEIPQFDGLVEQKEKEIRQFAVED